MSTATTAATGNARDFRLPDVGEGLTEADIVTWHVAVGDVVEENQTLVDIETAKSIVELPSPYAGEVLELLAAEGDTVEVGTPIIRIGKPGGGTAPPADAEAAEPADRADTSEPAEPAESGGPQEPKPLVGYGARPESLRRTRRGSAQQRSGAGSDAQETAKPRAKPPVRRLAKDLGIDLADVIATGPDRITTREDVEAHAGRSAPSAEAPSRQDRPLGGSGGDAERRTPVTGVRRHTAAAMVASAFTAPHATLFTTVDVTATMELRERLRTRPEFRETPLSPLTLVIRAYLRALGRTPDANARWVEGEGGQAEIVTPPHVHLGVAAATPRGLIVPVIERAETLDLAGIAVALTDLTAVARAGRTPPEAMTGGTTTVTNVGVFGIDGGTPILNPGETAILAVGAVRRQPWVVGSGDDERLEPRSVMQLSLSFDHRVIDGQQAAQVLADTAGVLEDPGLALL